MRRRALLAPALLLSLLPAVSAQACGSSNHYVETLAVALPSAPSSVRAGQPASLEVTVSRAGAPAGGADVYLRLQHGADPTDVSHGRGRTDATGRTLLRAHVPTTATGRLHVSVEAFSPLTEVPCYGSIEEHGQARSAWSRITR